MKFLMLAAAFLPVLSFAAPASVQVKGHINLHIHCPIIPVIKQISADVEALTSAVATFEGDFIAALDIKSDIVKLAGDFMFAINVVEQAASLTIQESQTIIGLLGGLEKDIFHMIKVLESKKGLLNTIILDAGSLVSFLTNDLQQVEQFAEQLCTSLMSKIIGPLAGDAATVVQHIIHALGKLVNILI